MKITELLIRLGGGEPQILEIIPTEKQKFVSNGLLNLFNALIITISVYKAGDYVFNSSLICISIALTGRFGHTDHPIPWQTDHLFCWQRDAADALAA